MADADPADGRLRLVPVDDQNRSDCIALQVKLEQYPLVASNKKSLRQAEQDPTLVPRAFTEGGNVVGFAMYQSRPDGSAYIWRVMVGAEHQRRGLGKRLMELLLSELRDAGFSSAYLSHRPQNRVAAHLFESYGFVEDDFEPDGEVVRRLVFPRQAPTASQA